MPFPNLLNDIRKGTANSSPWLNDAIILRDKLIFTADDGVHGRELWSTDGTAVGTRLLTDINPGTYSSFAENFTVLGNRIFFTARDSNGNELWASDGTSTGTKLVKDIAPGFDFSVFPSSSYPFSLTTFAGRLFFSANDGSSGRELWTSDGTSTGTFLVKDIFPGTNNSNYFSGPNNSDPTGLRVVGNQLLFWAEDIVNGVELWRVDQNLKASLVKDINPGPASSRVSGSFSYSMKTALGEQLFFDATDSRTGDELWISDGTAIGTRLLKDITPGSAGTFLADPTALGSKLFFLAKGSELWGSDGTADGTSLVKKFDPGNSVGTSLFDYTISAVAGGKLFLHARNSTGGHQLWASNGTTAGTQLLKVFNPVSPGSTNSAGSGSFTFLIKQVAGEKLYFTANDGRSGDELWVSDGTVAGTRLVKDILPGSQGSAPDGLTAIGNRLFFRANDGTNGRELWSSDGTAAGTRLEADLNLGPDGSSNQNTGTSDFDYTIKSLAGKLIFSGSDGRSGDELWALGIGGSSSSLSISALPASKAEGNSSNTPFVFRVSRSGNISGASTAFWQVEGLGPNTANQDDFVGRSFPSGTVSFAPREVSRTITVSVAGDTAVEANENFKVTLSGPSAGTSLLNASATATINNDDAVTQTLSSFEFGDINKSISLGKLLGVKNEFSFEKFIGINKGLATSVTLFDFKSKPLDARMRLTTAPRDRIKAGFNLSAGASLGSLEIKGGLGGKVLFNPGNGGSLNFDIKLAAPSIKTTSPYAYANIAPLLELNLNPKASYRVDPMDIPEVRIRIPKKIIVPKKCGTIQFTKIKKCTPEISTPAVDQVVIPKIKLGPYTSTAAPFPALNINRKFPALLKLDTRTSSSGSTTTPTKFQQNIGGAQLSASLPSLSDLSFLGTTDSTKGSWTGSVKGQSTLIDLNYDLLTLLPIPLSIKGELAVEGFGRVFGELYALKGLVGAKLNLNYSGTAQLKPILTVNYEGLAGSIDLDMSAASRGINFKDKPFKDLNNDGRIAGSVALDYILEGAFKASVTPQFNVDAKGLGGNGGFGVRIPGVVDESKKFGFGPFLNLGARFPATSISLVNKSSKTKLSSLVSAIAPKQTFSFQLPGVSPPSSSNAFVNPVAQVFQSPNNRSLDGTIGISSVGTSETKVDSSPSGATLTTATASGTIRNDDLIGDADPNTLVGTARPEFIDGRANLDTLTGEAAADVFGFRFGESPLSAPDRITDFAFGVDKIDLFAPDGTALPAPATFRRAANNASASTLSALAAAVFADANGAVTGNQALGANSAALVRATNAEIAGTYLVVNNATPGRSGLDDLMINLTGATGVLPPLGISAAGAVFV